MISRRSTGVGAAAILLVLSLASCRSAATRSYTLYAVPPQAEPSGYSGAAIRVDAVHFPPALDRLEVVTEVAPGELKINDLDHWSAPLGQAARQALSADLVARLPIGRVIFPHLAKSADALGLSVDVLDFKAEPQGAYLLASWVVSSASGDAQPRQATAKFTVANPSTSPRDTARALSALLAQLADRIVADL
jgi:uncharacterized lipoprotein YmbA